MINHERREQRVRIRFFVVFGSVARKNVESDRL